MAALGTDVELVRGISGPRCAAHDRAVLVLVVRAVPDVPSAVVKLLRRKGRERAAQGGRLVPAGVDPALDKLSTATGLAAVRAVRAGEEWISSAPADKT